MQQIRALFSKTETLAAQWRAMLSMAVVLLRQITQLERTEPRKALEKAEMLEAWCLLALTQVSFQITAQEAGGMPRNFSEQLPPIAVILSTILMLVRRMKAGLLSKINRPMAYIDCAQMVCAPAVVDIPAGLDSS